MSIFKKNNIVETGCDRMYYEMWSATFDKMLWLQECAKTVIIKSGVINLYLEGVDRDTAKKSFKNGNINYFVQ